MFKKRFFPTNIFWLTIVFVLIGVGIFLGIGIRPNTTIVEKSITPELTEKR